MRIFNEYLSYLVSMFFCNMLIFSFLFRKAAGSSSNKNNGNGHYFLLHFYAFECIIINNNFGGV